MEYFIMRQDKRYTNCIEPLKMKESFDKHVVRRSAIQFIDLTTPQMFYIKAKTENDYLDYLDSPFHLISDSLRQLFMKHEKRLFYKPIVLADVERMRQDYYWMVFPEIINCLTAKSEFNRDRTLKTAFIDTKEVGYCKIFKIDGILEDLIVVDLDIADEILANDFCGIKFEKIYIDESPEEQSGLGVIK